MILETTSFHISAAQCRAARGLLGWSQELLAENAQVSRATVAEFETNNRRPIKNNLRSISDCLFAAGVEFLDEYDDKGVGVRFRERKLEYINTVRLDWNRRRASIRMRYGGRDFQGHISFEAIDDYCRSNFSSEEQYSEALSSMLHIVLAAAERIAERGIENDELTISSDMLEA